LRQRHAGTHKVEQTAQKKTTILKKIAVFFISIKYQIPNEADVRLVVNAV